MKKVMIIEDDKKIAMALSIRLKAYGYDVKAAHDAVVAVSSAKNFRPNLILLDISMPGGDGFSLAERFSNLDITTGIPIIFITASKKIGLKEKALEMGAAGFFEKPYDTDVLLGKVSSLI
jgi:DNA-binding response OmpR family regulator